MTTATKVLLGKEVDETLAAIVDDRSALDKSATRDMFASHDQEALVAAALMDRWQARVNDAMNVLRNSYMTLDTYSTMYALNVCLSGTAITAGLGPEIQPHIAAAFNRGRQSTSHMFAKQTGSEPVRKDMNGNLFFGQLFGLTEEHALQALQDQLTVAAGGFWDEQLSASIKKELEGYFGGTETREQLVAKIEKMVNERLAISGKASLPSSYFDNLATHQIVRARNVGSYYRAKSLGAVHYTLINPHDGRTSPICMAVTQGQIYTMAGAEETVSGILTASSVSDLKRVAPFYKAGDEVTNPVPPLHWPKCRTWMNFVFEGV